MKTSATVLEFAPLRDLVGRYISSPLGRAELDKLEPYHDLERLKVIPTRRRGFAENKLRASLQNPLRDSATPRLRVENRPA
jgi:hypothetical protein